MNINEIVDFAQKFDVYGKLLTTKQQKILTSYIDYNGSISEIAESNQISRQAVLDLIKRTKAKLDLFEAKLKILEKQNAFKKELTFTCENLNLTKKQKEKIFEVIEKAGV